MISFVKGKTEISPDLPDILLASDIYQNITLQGVRYVVLFEKNMRVTCQHYQQLKQEQNYTD